MPVTDVLPRCGDNEPERNAGGPIDDGWSNPQTDPLSDVLAMLDRVKEVGDGVDSGAVPGQPAG